MYVGAKKSPHGNGSVAFYFFFIIFFLSYDKKKYILKHIFLFYSYNLYIGARNSPDGYGSVAFWVTNPEPKSAFPIHWYNFSNNKKKKWLLGHEP